MVFFLRSKSIQRFLKVHPSLKPFNKPLSIIIHIVLLCQCRQLPVTWWCSRDLIKSPGLLGSVEMRCAYVHVCNIWQITRPMAWEGVWAFGNEAQWQSICFACRRTRVNPCYRQVGLEKACLKPWRLEPLAVRDEPMVWASDGFSYVQVIILWCFAKLPHLPF